MRHSIILVVTAMLGTAAFVYAQQTANSVAADQPVLSEMLVHVARYAPALDVAETLSQLYEGDPRVRVVPDSVGNVVFVRITPGVRDDVVGVLEALDHHPKSVSVEVLLVRATDDSKALTAAANLSGPKLMAKVEDLEAAGRVFVSDRLQLTSLENQKAMVQVGQTKPIVTGSTFSARGRGNTYQSQQVGTLLSVTHRVSEDQITLELQFEKSDVAPSESADEAKSDAVPLSGVETTTVQTTVQLRSGEAIVVNGMAVRSTDGVEETVLVVSARVTESGPPRQASRNRAKSGSDERRGRETVTEVDLRYVKYAGGVIAKYDDNGDGCLQPKEWAKMSKSPAAADVDEDGKITPEELGRWYRQR